MRVPLACWDNVPKDEKAEFVRDANDLTGSELKAKMKQLICQALETKLTVALIGNGIFLDSPDLRHKYKSKPKQLESIRAHTNTFTCPIRNTRFYEDMDYTSASV